MNRADSLNQLLHTFSKDREFCDAFASQYPFETARLLVFLRWAQLYFSDIQDELHEMAPKHFGKPHLDQARFWTLALTGGIRKDIGLVPYLVFRGLIIEAGLAVRRGMENVGVLTHLWQDPAKAALLLKRDRKFRSAFENEPDPQRQKTLNARGVKKRFEKRTMGPALSSLYQIVSEYSVHGGSPSQLVTTEILPNQFSCGLVNQADPGQKDLSTDLEILGNGIEMICVETTGIHGQFGNQYGFTPSPGGEGGYFLTLLMNRGPESEMSKLQSKILDDLGWLAEDNSSGKP